MATTYSTHRNPWNLCFLLTGLVLGVCCLSSFGANRALAQVDEKSAIFQPASAGKANPAPVSQSMALPEETPTPSPSLFSTFLRLLLALGVTIGLIVATVWGLKWVWEKRGLGQWAEEGKAMKVLTSTFLSPRKTIYLVEVGKRILVVGAGGDELTCLDVIQDAEEVEALRNLSQQGFPKVFNRVIQNHEALDQEAEAKRILEESSQAVGGYVAKLKNMKKSKGASESMDEKK